MLEADEEMGVLTDSMPLSLECPITGLRIQNPGKSKLCNHIQVFDMKTFLTMNISYPKWRCPVCSVACNFEDLEFDEYVCSSSRVLKKS